MDLETIFSRPQLSRPSMDTRITKKLSSQGLPLRRGPLDPARSPWRCLDPLPTAVPRPRAFARPARPLCGLQNHRSAPSPLPALFIAHCTLPRVPRPTPPPWPQSRSRRTPSDALCVCCPELSLCRVKQGFPTCLGWEEGRKDVGQEGRQEAAGREGERQAGVQWGREHFLSGDVT